jgi:O-antigen ligase
MTDTGYSEAEQLMPNRPKRTDRWIAILGSSIPVAVVLGVVVFEFFVSLTGLVWLITRLKFATGTNGRLTRNQLFWPLSVWFLAIIASRLINGGSAYHFAHDIAFVRYPLFAAAMVDIAGRFPILRYLAIGLMVGIAYAGLNLASAHLIGYDFVGKPLARYIGKLNEGARTGALSAYAAPMLWIWAMVDKPLDKRRRRWILGIGVIALGLLISSRVRTALMAAVIGWLGTALSLLIIRKRINIGILMALLVVAGLAVGGIIWFQPNMESLYDRVYIWKVSFQVWLQNPVFGVGISSFGDAFLKVAESGIVAPYISPTGKVYQDITPHHAHNLFLQLLVCNGVLGLGAFLWTFIKATGMAWHLGTGRCAGLLCWPFVFAAIGITGWNIYDPFYTTLAFFFLAMISVSAIRDGAGVERA